jgi:hypothetical protein
MKNKENITKKERMDEGGYKQWTIRGDGENERRNPKMRTHTQGSFNRVITKELSHECVQEWRYVQQWRYVQRIVTAASIWCCQQYSFDARKTSE